MPGVHSEVAVGSGSVDSVFGRTGTVVASVSDYDASQVDNDSGVGGATVKDALNTLSALSSPVSSVFGRTGAVIAVAGDYDASEVGNDSGVVGVTVAAALNTLNTGKSATGHTHLLAQITDSGLLAAKNTVSTIDIDASAVTNAKLADVPTSTLKGRNSAGTGVATDLTAAQVRTMLNTDQITDPRTPTAHTHVLANITNAGTLAGLNSVGTSNITNDAVTNTKLANMATLTIKGRSLAGTGDPQDLTASQVRTILNIQDGAEANAVDSVFGRTGVIVSVAGDYAASQVNNDSGVPGATVADALDSLSGGHTHDASAIISGTFANARISQSSVDQHATVTPTAARIPLANGIGEIDQLWYPDFVGDSGSGGVKGAVPAPASGDAAAKRVLRADGTWADQSGGIVFAGAGSEGIVPDPITATGKVLTDNGTWVLLGAGTPRLEQFTLDGTDISNGYVTLSFTPLNTTVVEFQVSGAGYQVLNQDYEVDGGDPKQINWTGFALDGILQSGDTITVAYFS